MVSERERKKAAEEFAADERYRSALKSIGEYAEFCGQQQANITTKMEQLEQVLKKKGMTTSLLALTAALALMVVGTPASAQESSTPDSGCDYAQCWDKDGNTAEWFEWRRRASDQQPETEVVLPE